jgi:hypothetical protein
MIRLINWLDRTWSFDLPIGAFPAVLERLRGTPARAEDLAAGVPDQLLGARHGSAWSAKEHLGHLDDLHELDLRRLGEFLARAERLSAADMGNRRTEEANHRARPIREILEQFRDHRESLIRKMEDLTERDVAATALHPRLKRPLRLLDWMQFVADHDDHHLARAREAIRAARDAH